MSGSLATITSEEENDFIFDNLVNGNVYNGPDGGLHRRLQFLQRRALVLELGPRRHPLYFWNRIKPSSYGQPANWRARRPTKAAAARITSLWKATAPGTMSPIIDDYAVGYVVEFANYRMDGKYGYAIFNTADGTITYHLDNNDTAHAGAPRRQSCHRRLPDRGDGRLFDHHQNRQLRGRRRQRHAGDGTGRLQGPVGNPPDPIAPITVSLTGSDAEGPLSGFRITELPEHGTLYTRCRKKTTAAHSRPPLSPVGDNGMALIYFQPDADWNGRTTFHYAAVNSGDGAGRRTRARQATSLIWRR